TSVALAPDRLTVNTTSVPSAPLALSIDTVNGVSSSTIVPVPVAVPRLAPTGFVSVAVNVSSPSYSASPTVGTATGTLVLPAGTVTNNPDCAVYSAGDVAVPSAVSSVTVTSVALA